MGPGRIQILVYVGMCARYKNIHVYTYYICREIDREVGPGADPKNCLCEYFRDVCVYIIYTFA